RGPAGRGMAAAAFERRVLRRAAEHHYLRVRLELPDGGARPNAAQFKQLVVTALRELHGEVGAALPVDVLTYEEKTLSAILRVISSGLVKLWSALTLLGFYQNRRCAFHVLQFCLFFLSPNQTSPFLLALSGNSRELVLD
ncbi:RPP14 protein, partial [Agelaius phoeniceus]|nr:RPP14 protein [Agelaius phoeniceus]NXV61871.1 RPP14 protein [Molothrus ater]